jgi:hypothetical protein
MEGVAGSDQVEQAAQTSEQALQATEQKQTPQTAPQAAPTQDAAHAGEQTQPASEQATDAPAQAPATPGFGERGRMRRRARFLRKARELAYRDLGGLVFDLHRFGQRNDPVVMAKLATLKQIDGELRTLEAVLRERRTVTVLREVGIGACPRCAAIHGSDDRFCPGCGLAFDTQADRPIATAPVIAPLAPVVHTTAAPSTFVAPAATAGVPNPSAPTPASPLAQPAAASQTQQPRPPVSPSPPPAPWLARSPSPSTPPARPRATPVPAKPATTEQSNKQQDEDEPTQILRPPTAGT